MAVVWLLEIPYQKVSLRLMAGPGVWQFLNRPLCQELYMPRRLRNQASEECLWEDRKATLSRVSPPG